MKKTLKKLTNVTLATTLTVGPTVTPLMIQAEELDSSTVEEQLIEKLDGPTLENEQLLNELEKEQNEFLEEENLMEPLEELLTNESEEQQLLEQDVLEETLISQTEVESVHAETPEVMELSSDSFVLSDWTYTEYDNVITLKGYNGTETSIYVPGKYQDKQISLQDFSIFPSTMTHLQLEAIDGQKVKFSKDSFYEAFKNNKTIVSLDLSGLDTTRVRDTAYMFQNASNLTTLNLDGWDTSNVTLMFGMFYNTSKLTSVDVSGWDTSKVINMAQMFYGASSLETLDVSNWNTSNVTSMSSMFQGASKLTTLDVSGWDTSKVTDMNYMFYEASSLTKLDVSNWNTSKVRNMDSMFRLASELTALDVSDWDTSNVKYMNYMFSNVSKLTTLDVSGWDTSQVIVMSGLFYNLFNVTELDVSGWNTSNVLQMADVFYNTRSVTTLDVSNWDTSNVTLMNGMFFGAESLIALDLSNWDTSSVTDMRSMFWGAKSLTTLDVSGFNTSNVTDMGYMFRETPNLTTLDLSHFDTSKVTNMNSMFWESGIETVDLSGWNTSKVTNMNSMFLETTNLTTLDLSGWDTSNVTNMSSIFSYSSVMSLDLSGWDTSKVSDNYRRNMFYSSTKRTLLIITTDKNIKNYNFKADRRQGVQFCFDAQGGIFEDGSTRIVSSELIVLDNRDKVFIQELIESVRDSKGEPTKKGHIFNGWVTPTVGSTDFETLFNCLNGTYSASWTNTEPVIQATDQIIQIGDSFNPLAHVSVTDTEDGPITLTEDNIIFNNVDPSVPGNYQVTYEVTDQGDLTVSKTITVTVNDKPVIEANDQVIHVGDDFNPLDVVSVNDAEDGPITLTEDNITFNNVEPLTPGIYQVTYEVTDRYGATVTKTITVLVNDKPVIQAENIALQQGDSFNPLDYVSVTDTEDGTITLTGDNVIFNDVDSSTPGTYQVTYEVTDQHGATVTKTITVTVHEKEVIETPDQDAPTDDDKPTTEKPNQESSKPTTDHQKPHETEQEKVETGVHGSVLFVGLTALFTGMMSFKQRKHKNQS